MEGEWNIPPFSGQFVQLFEEDLYIWGDTMGGFGSEHTSSGFYYKLFLYSLASLGMNGEFISKALSVFILSITGYSMFFLGRKIGLGISSSFIAGVFFMMTPEVFNRFGIGHISELLSNAILPFVIAFFIGSLTGKSRMKSLLLAATLAAVVSIQLTNYFVLAAILFLYTILYSLSKKNIRDFLLILRNTSFVLIIPLLSQAYWIIPFALDLSRSAEMISAELGYVPVRFLTTEGYVFKDVIRFLGTHVNYFQLEVGESSFWQLVSFLPATLAFIALIQSPRSKYGFNCLFYGILVILGISLASAGKGPLGDYWSWILETIPFTRIFRSPEKWYPLLSVGLAVLLGLSSEVLRERLRKLSDFSDFRLVLFRGRKALATVKISPTKRTVPSILISLIFLSCIFSYGYPFFTSNFNRMHTYDFGEKYEELWEWTSKGKEDYRVLMLPAPYPTLYNDAEWTPTPGYDMMSRYIGRDFLYYGKLSSPQFETFLIKSMYDPMTNNLSDLLSIAGVKYIIFDTNKQTTVTQVGRGPEFPDMWFTNDKLKNTLSQQANLKLVNSYDTIRIYRNTEYSGHIFPVNRVILFAGDLDGLVGLTYLDNLDLRNTGLIFINQLSREEFLALTKLPEVEVMIQDGHYIDLIETITSKEYSLRPVQYVTNNNPEEGWTMMQWTWYKWQYQATTNRPAFTFSQSELNIPHSINENREYEIYLKSYFGKRASNIEIFVDNSIVGQVTTKHTIETGFQWSHIGSVSLSKGIHDFKIVSGNGENAITDLMVIPSGRLDESSRAVKNILKNTNVRILSELSNSEWIGGKAEWGDEETPFFVAHWDDDLDYWKATGGGSGDLDFSEITADKSVVKKGENSIKLNITSGGSYSYVALDHSFTTREDWARFPTLSLWLHGNKTGELTYIRIEDHEGNSQEWRPIDDWIGWKRIHLNLREPDKSWGNTVDLSDISIIRISKTVPGDLYLDRGGLDFSTGQTNFLETGLDSSQGSVLKTVVIPFHTSVYIPKEGDYRIFIRASGFKGHSEISVGKYGDTSTDLEIKLGAPPNEYHWYDVGLMHLTEGISKISFVPDGTDLLHIDQILFMESPVSEVNSPSVDLSYEKINPTKYEIDVDSTEPFYIIFSERFDKDWMINLEDGTQIESYPAYTFGNLFFINKTSEFKMSLDFEKQSIYDFGKIISFTTLGTLVVCILMPSRSIILIKNIMPSRSIILIKNSRLYGIIKKILKFFVLREKK